MRDRTVWLTTVVGRAAAFLFLCILVLTGLFFLGNIQEFLDTTQIMLLSLIDVISPIFLFAGFSFAVMLVVDGFRRKSFSVGRFLVTFLGMLIVSVLFVFSSFLNAWMS